ncbi:MAG: TPM domain-containing protein [Epsilonproteobacteria bacterium]|nr:TPM domain-containing protein [Campylobacterota bacterium]
MRTILKKIGVLFALLMAFSLASFADINNSVPAPTKLDSKFILNGAKMIDPRAIAKIDEMGNELLNKTGVSVYIYATEHYTTKEFPNKKSKMEFIKLYEQNITKNLKNPFVLLSMSLEDTHINLLSSPELKKVVDKDEILDKYIIPLLASKDKNSMYSKVSAAMFNGYAAITDAVAKSNGIELKSSIGSSGTVASTIWRVFMYTVVVIGLILYTIAVLKSKKK